MAKIKKLRNYFWVPGNSNGNGNEGGGPPPSSGGSSPSTAGEPIGLLLTLTQAS